MQRTALARILNKYGGEFLAIAACFALSFNKGLIQHVVVRPMFVKLLMAAGVGGALWSSLRFVGEFERPWWTWDSVVAQFLFTIVAIMSAIACVSLGVRQLGPPAK
jgi:hypothetical protein